MRFGYLGTLIVSVVIASRVDADVGSGLLAYWPFEGHLGDCSPEGNHFGIERGSKPVSFSRGPRSRAKCNTWLRKVK